MQLVLPHLGNARVLVVGDVMLDRYWHGSSSRISPEAPVPIVKVEESEDRPGGAGNVALNLAALGVVVAVVGVVGDDQEGVILRNQLQSAGIDTDFQISTNSPTITKLRVISRHQQLLRMDFETPFYHQDSSEFVAKTQALIAGVNVLVLSDYGKGSLQDCQALIRLAHQHSIPVLVDPKGNNFSRYQGASLLTPNQAEFEAVVGHCESDIELVAKGYELIQKLALGALLITRGEHGMTLLRQGEPALHLPALAREVFDVTGAGDTVIATLAAAIAAGQSMAQSMALANLAAGIVVGKLGTAAVSYTELRRAILLEQGVERGVVNYEQLFLAMEDARASGEKIVFTNGCFDILHAGHVSYLEQARKLGNRLIVAVNSDASVKRLKGASRPINTLERRMAVLAGLEAVDWVISFDEDTPERLLKLLKPDVLVKGGDYSKSEVVGADIVNGYGGTVRVLGYVDNCSTTATVEQIKAH